MRILELASGAAILTIFAGSVLISSAGVVFVYMTIGPWLTAVLACLLVAGVCFLIAGPRPEEQSPEQ